MVMINVQFRDSSQKEIVTYFGCKQDDSTYPNQGMIESGDDRYVSFYEAQPTMNQRYLPNPM